MRAEWESWRTQARVKCAEEFDHEPRHHIRVRFHLRKIIKYAKRRMVLEWI